MTHSKVQYGCAWSACPFQMLIKLLNLLPVYGSSTLNTQLAKFFPLSWRGKESAGSNIWGFSDWHNKVPKTRWLKTEIYHFPNLSFLKTRNLKLRCQKSHAVSERSREESFLVSSTFGVFGNLWHSLTCRCITTVTWLSSLYLHIVYVCFLCVQVFPFYKDNLLD